MTRCDGLALSLALGMLGCTGDADIFAPTDSGGDVTSEASADGKVVLTQDAAADAHATDARVARDGGAPDVGDAPTQGRDGAEADALVSSDAAADAYATDGYTASDAHRADAWSRSDADDARPPSDAPQLEAAAADGGSAPSCVGMRSEAGAIQPVDDPRATIRNVTVAGDLCEPGTEVVNISQDGEAVTVVFSTGLLGQEHPVSASCTVTIEMEEPAGYHMGAPYLQWLGTGAATTVLRHYRYEGADVSPAFVNEITGDYGFVDKPVLTSPSCTRPGRVRFVATIVPIVHQAGELFSLFAFDVVTAWRSGVTWRRGCNGASTLVTAAPAEAGQWCGGRQSRGCGCGLQCEYDLTGSNDKEGSCVDPAASWTPGDLGDPCGGLRGIGCSEGLVCWRASQEAVTQGWLGRCAAPMGGVNATCASGVPALPCASPLYCSLAPHRCVEANGQAGSLCGEGLPECSEGLRCNGTVCAVPRTLP